MKKFICVILSLLCLGSLTACSFTEDPDTNLVHIKSKGAVVESIVEDFDKSYYNVSELESVIKDEVATYNTNKGSEAVKLSKCEDKDGKVKVRLEYEAVADYAAFNGINFYSGTVADAIKDGYDFNVSLSEKDSDKKADSKEIKKLSDYQVIITDEVLNIEVDSDIVYFSENVTLTKDKVASITQQDGQKAQTYIIYK